MSVIIVLNVFSGEVTKLFNSPERILSINARTVFYISSGQVNEYILNCLNYVWPEYHKTIKYNNDKWSLVRADEYKYSYYHRPGSDIKLCLCRRTGDIWEHSIGREEIYGINDRKVIYYNNCNMICAMPCELNNDVVGIVVCGKRFGFMYSGLERGKYKYKGYICKCILGKFYIYRIEAIEKYLWISSEPLLRDFKIVGGCFVKVSESRILQGHEFSDIVVICGE